MYFNPKICEFFKENDYLDIFIEYLEQTTKYLYQKSETQERKSVLSEALSSYAASARSFNSNLTKYASQKFSQVIQNEDEEDLSSLLQDNNQSYQDMSMNFERHMESSQSD